MDLHKMWRECGNQLQLVRSEILKVVSIENTTVWDVTPYSLIDGYRN